MRKLFPVSGLRVVFPDSPDILSVEEQNVWRDYRSRVRLDIAETALFAGRIWLEHLFGVRRKAHLTDSERSDVLYLNLDDCSWWYKYFYALYVEPAAVTVQWQSSCEYRVGEAIVGSATVGDGGAPHHVSVVDFRLG